jgi:hypothetical protein
MLELFASPAALTIGGAMISLPILIHLINRMRFKRLRWAAMEFLLKSQKRNRRRLIIEQLLLLALRCLLIGLVAFLFSRFLGCESRAGEDGKAEEQSNLHIVLLNDSLSMNDRVKGQDDCFNLGRKHILETIAPAMGKSATPDRLVVVQLSRVIFEGKDYKPKVYDGLEQPSHVAALEHDMKKMTCSKLSLPVGKGLERVQELVKAAKEENVKVIVHIVSDFRKHRWVDDANKGVQQMVKDLAKTDHVKMVWLADVADVKQRDPKKQTGPTHHDNLAIVELRANTRIATPGSGVVCTVTVANYGIQSQDVMVELFNYETGQGDVAANYVPPQGRLEVPSGKRAQATISITVPEDPKEKAEHGFYRVGVRLLNSAGLPLDTDGLGEDNVRFLTIDVRNRIPILIIDGRGEAGLTDYGDAYWVSTALKSYKRSQYEVVFAKDLSALESPDLNRFTTIFLLNVPELAGATDASGKEKLRRENLERFVAGGGGLTFFLGKDVNAKYYNDKLFNKGLGLFPVPLDDETGPRYNGPPPKDKKKVDGAEWFTNRALLLMREDQFPGEQVPILGPIFPNPKALALLKFLHARRYWPARPYSEWKTDITKAREVANLPNEEDATQYANDILPVKKLLQQVGQEYKAYQRTFDHFADELALTGRKDNKDYNKKTFELAAALEALLAYSGGDYPSLTDFWDLGDKRVKDVKAAVEKLRRKLLFSSPLLMVRDFGQGRVAAFMTTGGNDWQNWADGVGALVYPAIMNELQNYLTSSSGDSGKLVGEPLVVTVDGVRFPEEMHVMQGELLPTQADNTKQRPSPALPLPKLDVVKKVKGGPLALEYSTKHTLVPGYYQTKLFKKLQGAGETKAPLAQWAEVFNVDAVQESNLERASTGDIYEAIIKDVTPREGNAPAKVKWWEKQQDGESNALIVKKPWDLSEWPLLFLLFLAVLVAEQALAVHLSFHLKTNEAELPTQVVKPQARAA